MANTLTHNHSQDAALSSTTTAASEDALPLTTISLARAPLEEAVKQLAPLVAKRSSAPIFTYVMLEASLPAPAPSQDRSADTNKDSDYVLGNLSATERNEIYLSVPVAVALGDKSLKREIAAAQAPEQGQEKQGRKKIAITLPFTLLKGLLDAPNSQGPGGAKSKGKAKKAEKPPVVLSWRKPGSAITLRCGGAEVTGATLYPEDWPATEAPDPATTVLRVDARALASALEQVAYAAYIEEIRYYLRGVYMHGAGRDPANILGLAATDGHRLARAFLPKSAVENIKAPKPELRPDFAQSRDVQVLRLTSEEMPAFARKSYLARREAERRIKLDQELLKPKYGNSDSKSKEAVEKALAAVAEGEEDRAIIDGIVPSRTIHRLRRLLSKVINNTKKEGARPEIYVAASPSRVAYMGPDWILESKLIDGTFPVYERAMPSPERRVKTFTVPRQALVEALESVQALTGASKRGFMPVVVNVTPVAPPSTETTSVVPAVGKIGEGRVKSGLGGLAKVTLQAMLTADTDLPVRAEPTEIVLEGPGVEYTRWEDIPQSAREKADPVTPDFLKDDFPWRFGMRLRFLLEFARAVKGDTILVGYDLETAPITFMGLSTPLGLVAPSDTGKGDASDVDVVSVMFPLRV